LRERACVRSASLSLSARCDREDLEENFSAARTAPMLLVRPGPTSIDSVARLSVILSVPSVATGVGACRLLSDRVG